MIGGDGTSGGPGRDSAGRESGGEARGVVAER